MKKKLKKVCLPVIVMAVVFALFRFVLFIGYVPTESMEPTIHKGSYIVGTKIFGELNVGDIIVFRHEGRLLVKRIATVEGNVVEHKENTRMVSDRKFYVLGDNRDNSTDSRAWEKPFVEQKDVLAVLFRENPLVLPIKKCILCSTGL